MTPPKKPDDKKPRWSRAQKQEAQRAPARRSDGPSSRGSDAPRTSDRRHGGQGGPGGVRSYNNRDSRPSYNRDSRPSFSRDSRDDRGGERRSSGNREDRPAYNRDDRPAYNRDNRDSRPSYNRDNRDSRPSYNKDNRDSRPSYNKDNRDSRPSYNRDNRPARDDRGGERRSYNNREDRPVYNNSSNTDRTYPRQDTSRDSDRGSRVETPRDETQVEQPVVDAVADQDGADNARVDQGVAAIGTPMSDDSASSETTDDSNGFADLLLPDVLVRQLARDGITSPFPIQAATIPDALAGRDVLGRGRTGSGKTLAFGLPTLTRLAQGGKARPQCPRAVVLVPTRELAMQVSDALQPLVHAIGLHHKLVAGGMPYEPQLQALARGVDLLIATPGRLMDLINRGAADLSRVEIAILDEADHMAEMGFLEDITTILDTVPAGGQRLLFSATLDRGIDTVVKRYLIDPVTHSTDDGTVSISTMAHHALLIEPRDKKIVTAEVANREGRTVIFSRTKLGADRIASELREQGVLAAALHGGLNQGQRNKVLSAFKDGRIPVLVATDVAARGIHVDDVGVVLQVDPPADHKDYLHRAGRTARAGEAGTVVTLALPHQRKAVTRLLEQAGVEGGLQRARPGDEVIRAAGGRTPEDRPISDQDLHRILTPKREQGRGGSGGGGARRGGRPGNYRGGPSGSARRFDGANRGRPRD